PPPYPLSLHDALPIWKGFADIEVEDRLPAVQAALLGDVGEGVAGSHGHLRGSCSCLGKGGVEREHQEPAGADQPRVGQIRAVGSSDEHTSELQSPSNL